MTVAPHRYDVKRAEHLTADEREAWREMVHARPTLWNPYFQLEFVEQMQAISNRVRIVVVREAGAPIAFLPFLPVMMGFAQPVGGPICDIHGLIATEPSQVDLRSLLEAAGISLFTFHQAPSDQAAFERYAHSRFDCHAADLSGGYDAWFDIQSGGGKKKVFKDLARLTRGLERDHGAIRFELNDTSEAAFEKLLQWKSAQYRRSRYFDVFSVRWTVNLMRRLWAMRDGPLQGQLSTLYSGERLVAVHFGMMGERVANGQFITYDLSYGKYSPGQMINNLMFRGWANEGVQRVDMGGGDTYFKLKYGGTRLGMMAGMVRRPSLASQAYQLASSLSGVVAKTPNNFIAKLPHRIGVRLRNRLLYRLV